MPADGLQLGRPFNNRKRRDLAALVSCSSTEPNALNIFLSTFCLGVHREGRGRGENSEITAYRTPSSSCSGSPSTHPTHPFPRVSSTLQAVWIFSEADRDCMLLSEILPWTLIINTCGSRPRAISGPRPLLTWLLGPFSSSSPAMFPAISYLLILLTDTNYYITYNLLIWASLVAQ